MQPRRRILATASNQLNIDDCLTHVWPSEVANILGEFPDRLSLLAANNSLMQHGPAVTPNPARKCLQQLPLLLPSVKEAAASTARYNDPFIDFHGARGTHVWMAASRVAAANPKPHAASCKLRSWENGTGDLLDCLNVRAAHSRFDGACCHWR